MAGQLRVDKLHSKKLIFNHFEEEKIATAGEMARVACPVGIKIRSQSVPEIAVSIMAQFIDKRAELAGEKQISTAAKAELVQGGQTPAKR